MAVGRCGGRGSAPVTEQGGSSGWTGSFRRFLGAIQVAMDLYGREEENGDGLKANGGLS